MVYKLTINNNYFTKHNQNLITFLSNLRIYFSPYEWNDMLLFFIRYLLFTINNYEVVYSYSKLNKIEKQKFDWNIIIYLDVDYYCF